MSVHSVPRHPNARRDRIVNKHLHLYLSRRESQIMDVLFRLGEANVSDVVAEMPDDASYNSVRVTLRILETKGYVRHRNDGPRYLYAPAHSTEQVKRSATRHLLRTFYEGSPSRAVLGVLGMSAGKLTPEDLDEISTWIEEAKKKAANN